jgi:hypothetical protein
MGHEKHHREQEAFPLAMAGEGERVRDCIRASRAKYSGKTSLAWGFR